MGATQVGDVLPGLVEAVKREGRAVLWVCDPMHGNTQNDSVRAQDARLRRHLARGRAHLRRTRRVRDATSAGVHFEMTGEDVTECIGGAAGITVDDLDRNYASACDPRLNYRQTLEMGFRIAKRLGSHGLAR